MKKISLVFLLVMIVLVGGCSLNDGSSNPVETPVAIMAVYNGNADADADVNMILNSVQVNGAPIAYKTFLDYFKLDPGDKAIKFKTTAGATVVDTTFTLASFKAYTVFLTKKYNSTKVISIFTMDQGTLTVNTNTMVRFINLSPDAPAVDVKFVGESSVFASGIPFMLMTDYKEISPFDYSVQIVKSSDGSVLATASLSSTGSGYYQTIVLSGYVSSPVGGANTLTTKVLHD